MEKAIQENLKSVESENQDEIKESSDEFTIAMVQCENKILVIESLLAPKILEAFPE